MKGREWQMKEGLPVLKEPPLSISNLENEFGSSLDKWEDRIFLEATHFRLHRFKIDGGVDRAEVKDFEHALHLAGIELRAQGHRVLIYAIAASGRFVCLERKRWAHFLELWTNKKDETSKTTMQKL